MYETPIVYNCIFHAYYYERHLGDPYGVTFSLHKPHNMLELYELLQFMVI